MTEDSRIICGDCAEVLASMEPDSVDAIVTDPPYGLSFMGKEWDSFGTDTRQPRDEHYWVPDNPYGRAGVRYGWNQDKSKLAKSNRAFQDSMTPIFESALRVAKSGAHLLCFGGTRTFHRMACAIEDAGWEIRDCIMWVYGSGFPKSMDVGKKLSEWQGWGTCLKPAWEPIIVARKPLDGTVAHNVMTHGTGALNIDRCRVATEDDVYTHGDGETAHRNRFVGQFNHKAIKPNRSDGQALGRFPANLVHDGSDEVLALFPDSKGQQAPVRGVEPSRIGGNGIYGSFAGPSNACAPRGDSGSAARFFYCAKASKADRGEGNDHPTVKPTALMQWLVRLVCPVGGTVLDPFCGSGSTGVACVREGITFIGIEREQHYAEIARKRIDDAAGEHSQGSLF